MTTGTETTEGSSVNETDGDTLFAINERTYEDAGESYLFKVWQRLCWSGECRLCRPSQEGKPIVPGRTTEHSIYNATKICPTKVQFITPGMSLLEAIFRILIINGNQPMKFNDIVAHLKEHWGAEYPQRVESVDSLRRIMDAENEYHIGRAATD